MKKLFLPLLVLLTFQSTFAQFSWNAELNLQGMASTEDEQLPFWMHHNQRGRIEKETNLATWLYGKAFYDLGKSGKLEAAVGLLARDAQKDKVFTDELYLTYTIDWLEFTVGRKQRPELYNGLSASNESILWSLNARPLPGIQLKTKRPVFIFKNFGFEASWDEYLMDDDRFVDNTRLHHKKLRLVYNNERSFEIKAGIQHFVQWGGKSLVHGEQPSKVVDYLRIITGRGGNADALEGDQQNALGNHIGGYEMYLTKNFKSFDLELFYNHLFEDGSGSRFGNTPDGRYGAFVNLHSKDNFINSVVYEIYYTKHQSHTTSGAHISDNYFNNGIYRSGWTYEEKIIGAPFFLINYYDGNYTQGFVRVANNIYVAHNIGIEGLAFRSLPYKFITSYRKNYGHKRIISGFQKVDHFKINDARGRNTLPAEALSNYLAMYVLNSPVSLNLILSLDISNEGFVGGIGLHAVYKIR